jgi:hypothetical protein
VFPKGSKRHKVWAHPKAAPWKMPGHINPLWNDQWGYGIVQWIIGIFTRPGETVGDMFCGTGTATTVAIKMGRHAIAVDKHPQALIHTNCRLLELKSNEELKELDNWACGSNPMDMISYIPDWSTCNWQEIADREKTVREHRRKQEELDRKNLKKDKANKKKADEKKRAELKAAQKKKEADEAAAAAKAIEIEPIAEIKVDAGEAEEEDEEPEITSDADPDEDEEDPIDIGTMPPNPSDTEPLPPPAGVDDDTTPPTGPVTPAQTRSKGVTQDDE